MNLVKRIDQWSKQCESKEQVLRGFWPGDGSADTSNLMKGRVKAGNPGKYCYRLERLIHLELADLMHNKPYLLPGFPKLDTAPDRNTAAVQKRKCPDCMHFLLFYGRVTESVCVQAGRRTRRYSHSSDTQVESTRGRSTK